MSRSWCKGDLHAYSGQGGLIIMMDIADAFQIVLDLARQNIIDEIDNPDEHAKQVEACDTV